MLVMDVVPRNQRLLELMRADLLWLAEDGYREDRAIVSRSSFDLWLAGPPGRGSERQSSSSMRSSSEPDGDARTKWPSRVPLRRDFAAGVRW